MCEGVGVGGSGLGRLVQSMRVLRYSQYQRSVLVCRSISCVNRRRPRNPRTAIPSTNHGMLGLVCYSDSDEDGHEEALPLPLGPVSAQLAPATDDDTTQMTEAGSDEEDDNGDKDPLDPTVNLDSGTALWGLIGGIAAAGHGKVAEEPSTLDKVGTVPHSWITTNTAGPIAGSATCEVLGDHLPESPFPRSVDVR